MNNFIQACICNMLHDQRVYPPSDFFQTRQFGFVVYNARGDLNTYIADTLQAAWHWVECGHMKRICACVFDDDTLQFRLEFEFVGIGASQPMFVLAPEQARLCLRKLSSIPLLQPPPGSLFSLLFEVNLPSSVGATKNSGLIANNVTTTIPIATLLVNSITRMCVKLVVVVTSS